MLIKEVVGYCCDLHQNQKYGNAPFIVHPYLVARHFTDPKLIAIALLHDSVEDANADIDYIARFLGSEVADAVVAISRNENENYFSYIDRLSQNELASQVKIADLKENLFSATNMYKGEYESQSVRWESALEILLEKYPQFGEI